MDPKPQPNYQNGDQTLTFYGLHIPLDTQLQENIVLDKVYEDKTDVLKLIKKYKKARFKGFSNYEDAVDFADRGCEYPNNYVTVDGAQKDNVGEKPSQFRGPTSQNLVKLRKGIEAGDLNFVQKTVWDNPRYLIGSGDTPCILQEGFRYNGLHIACKSRNADMCELILNTISDVTFIRKLYMDDKHPEERSKILLDLYLNTPDKGLNETPLHFAVKFGAVRCVEVLVSFPECAKDLRNKHDKMPKQIICDRYDGPDSLKISEEICHLLQDNYYVPVLRSEDNCEPPKIGHPFSPTSPPNFNSDPFGSRLEIHAYAGPMHKQEADRFRKLWKTPPRTLNFLTPRKSALNKSIDSIATLKMKDHEKGLERLGNDIARKLEVGWKEYWGFLDNFVDISSKEGLALLESYLGGRALNYFRNSVPSSPELESGSDSPPQVSELSPMTELCKALQTCSLKDRSRSVGDEVQPTHLSPHLCIDKSLQVFAKRISDDILYLLEVQYDTCTVLEAQVKQLQHLMLSYQDDVRFKSIDFQLVHPRLAYLLKTLLVNKLHDLGLLHKMLDLWLEFFGKNYDCFSSDDEGVQGTVVQSKNQHSVCILKTLQEFLVGDFGMEEAQTEEDCARAWRAAKRCGCAWRGRCGKKSFGGRRANSFKLTRTLFRQENLSRKLSYNEDDDSFGGKTNCVISNGDCLDNCSSDEEFFTPPSTPSLMDEDKSEDEDNQFDETQLPEAEVFIEGDFPTKVDAAVFNALNYAECQLTPKEYPNIYRWRHAVGLYNEQERQTWTSPNGAKCKLASPQQTSTPLKLPLWSETTSPTYTPSKSWRRITGANSPRASLKRQEEIMLDFF